MMLSAESDPAAEVLQRFGFSKLDEAPSLNAATARLEATISISSS